MDNPILASVVETPRPEWPVRYYWQEQNGFIARERHGYSSQDSALVEGASPTARLVTIPGTAALRQAEERRKEREDCANKLGRIGSVVIVRNASDFGAKELEGLIHEAIRLLRTTT